MAIPFITSKPYAAVVVEEKVDSASSSNQTESRVLPGIYRRKDEQGVDQPKLVGYANMKDMKDNEAKEINFGNINVEDALHLKIRVKLKDKEQNLKIEQKNENVQIFKLPDVKQFEGLFGSGENSVKYLGEDNLVELEFRYVKNEWTLKKERKDVNKERKDSKVNDVSVFARAAAASDKKENMFRCTEKGKTLGKALREYKGMLLKYMEGKKESKEKDELVKKVNNLSVGEKETHQDLYKRCQSIFEEFKKPLGLDASNGLFGEPFTDVIGRSGFDEVNLEKIASSESAPLPHVAHEPEDENKDAFRDDKQTLERGDKFYDAKEMLEDDGGSEQSLEKTSASERNHGGENTFNLDGFREIINRESQKQSKKLEEILYKAFNSLKEDKSNKSISLCFNLQGELRKHRDQLMRSEYNLKQLMNNIKNKKKISKSDITKIHDEIFENKLGSPELDGAFNKVDADVNEKMRKGSLTDGSMETAFINEVLNFWKGEKDFIGNVLRWLEDEKERIKVDNSSSSAGNDSSLQESSDNTGKLTEIPMENHQNLGLKITLTHSDDLIAHQ